MEQILRYFPDLSDKQKQQFAALDALYRDWNAKINVIYKPPKGLIIRYAFSPSS